MSGAVKKGSQKAKKGTLKFTIDCTIPDEDQIMTLAAFETFLKEKVKINNKAGVIKPEAKGLPVSITSDKETHKITITAEPPFAKHYLKYLTKKFLKKNNLRDFLRVIAPNRTTYQLRYFQIESGEEEQES